MRYLFKGFLVCRCADRSWAEGSRSIRVGKDGGFAEAERISMLKAMVRLSNRNRKLRAEKKLVSACPHCKGIGQPYKKRNHPKKEDCAGTGVATDWKR